jgi:hypothetical protein
MERRPAIRCFCRIANPRVENYPTKMANEPIDLTTMPSALLSHILRTQDLRQKQVGIPDRGRSATNFMPWLTCSFILSFVTAAIAYFGVSCGSLWGMASYLLAAPAFALAARMYYIFNNNLVTAACLFVLSFLWFSLVTFPFWNKKDIGNISRTVQIIFVSCLWILSIPVCIIFIIPSLNPN